jgi:protein involved in polysaccharide export with SLBB domain
VNNLRFFSLIALIFLSACSTNHSLKDYPKYTDQIKQSMEAESKNKSETDSGLDKEIPDLSKIPNYVAPGFSFQISHPSDSRLSGVFRSDFNGNLQLPYDVNINITDKSFAAVKEQVLKSYRKFFQKGVDGVNFTIAKKEYWVEVRGLVKKPGRYLVKQSDTLDLVVDAAGGVQGDVSVDYFTAGLKQQTYEYKVLLNKYFESNSAADKIRWLGGDSLFISKLDSLAGKTQEIPFVTIIGGVIKPGKVLYQKNASLYYFIEKSGGTISALGYTECFVFRNTKEGVKKIEFAFDQPETIPAIMPNDTIYMNTQVRKESDIWLERLGHIAGIFSSIALAIIAL